MEKSSLFTQEIIDTLLIPGRFPPPTHCSYGGRLPNTIENSMRSLTEVPAQDLALVTWKFFSLNNSYRISIEFHSDFILVAKSISNFNNGYDFTSGYDNEFSNSFFIKTILHWKYFVSVLLPQWFKKTTDYYLVPMKPQLIDLSRLEKLT